MITCYALQVTADKVSLQAKDFEEAGFVRLDAQSFLLKGYILTRSYFGYDGPRAQTIYLLYKSK